MRSTVLRISAQEIRCAYNELINGELSYHEALNGTEKLKWETAIKEEIKGLRKKEVFIDEECPSKIKSLETRFVLTKKLNDDTSIRYIARLVVKGYRQKYGIDYTETSPVMHFDAFRAIIAIAARNGWNVKTLDFTQAYLNADLKEDLWVILSCFHPKQNPSCENTASTS